MLKSANFLLLRPSRGVARVASTAKVQRQPLITCKRPEFNLYVGDRMSESAKFGSIPLASEKWRSRKSKSDFFILHPMMDLSDYESLDTARTLADFDLHPTIVTNLAGEGIEHPTRIQSAAIPVVMSGNHALIAAETGCGKTLAYLLPIVEQIRRRKAMEKSDERTFNSPLAMVVTPGRELAEQIGAVAETVCRGLGVNYKVVIGGGTKKKMMNPTFEDIDLYIGSIGATSKLVTTGIYRIKHVRHMVLDEADTLLDDSFNEKLVFFLRRFPLYKNNLQELSTAIVGCQLVLASATMPTNTAEALQKVINPDAIEETVSPNLHRVLRHVPQRFLRMGVTERPFQLLRLVKADMERRRPVIVFGNKGRTSDYVSLFLNENGVQCINLNGDMSYDLRAARFTRFQAGEVDILSTTDVASRGLDTRRVKHVINFDTPLFAADYVHRCGRTGRVGGNENCWITNFVSSPREIDMVNKIEHAARTNQLLPDVNANKSRLLAQYYGALDGEDEQEGGRGDQAKEVKYF